ncbi:MAG: hypothetical protein R3F40_10980 [Candidatus Competibacteraceae bacterium]
MAKPADCVAVSPSTRTALVELHLRGLQQLSPADRWLSRQTEGEWDARQVVALAFHVDCGDRLG